MKTAKESKELRTLRAEVAKLKSEIASHLDKAKFHVEDEKPGAYSENKLAAAMQYAGNAVAAMGRLAIAENALASHLKFTAQKGEK